MPTGRRCWRSTSPSPRPTSARPRDAPPRSHHPTENRHAGPAGRHHPSSQAASYALEDLPETIAFPQRAGDEPREPLPVVEATVDEIAFAIVEAERESTAAYRRADALKRLYKLAREAGCIGADRAATAVMKKEGQ
jgi:hypothetical protein